MPRQSTSHGLKLNVAAVKITSVGRARRSRPACIGRLREHATSKVRFVVRRRHGKNRITTNPVGGKKCPGGRVELRYGDRLAGSGLRGRGKGCDGRGEGQKKKDAL